MQMHPWDQRIARVLVKPLVNSPVTPNQVTVFTLVLALTGAGMLTIGQPFYTNLGVGLFVLARFFDHFDGELARQKNMTSRLGYYLDYLSGAGSYSTLFVCLGICFHNSELGFWSIGLGLLAATAAVISMFINLGFDCVNNSETTENPDAVGYPGFAGFELEDGIYLIAPITWLGWLMPFFVVAALGAAIYCLWSLVTLICLRKRQ
jgi:archaetidylinositol phosphate synthase